MNLRVEIKAELYRWATERSRLDEGVLTHHFPHYTAWVRGESSPTLRQLESFAQVTHTPIGYLFLQTPPEEPLPIPDFRTAGSRAVLRPSPDLLDTINICRQRQEWYREYALENGEVALDFIGSAKLSDDPVAIAPLIRQRLGLDTEERGRLRTWEDALRDFIAKADEAGILVMCSGVVLNNNTRKLDVAEFRGFALSDPLAPLIFVNGSDSKAAQMFTVAHEIAHLWLGSTALSGVDLAPSPQETERWCNKVAAEVLVPESDFKANFDGAAEAAEELPRLARRYKVSALVIIRRLYDSGLVDFDRYRELYEAEEKRLHNIPHHPGGDFYLTQSARVGKRFARSLISSTLEGRTLHRDAFRLIGFSKLSTFQELGRNLGLL